MVQIKIITSPEGTLEGESLTKNNLIWVAATGKGWHLCFDDEIQTSLSNDQSNTQANNNSNNSSNSGGLSSSDKALAGKYAKAFASKMMYKTEWLSNPRNVALSIADVKIIKRDNKDFFAVKSEVSWTTGEYFSVRTFTFKGYILFDYYGCDSFFLIYEKNDLVILGNKRVYPFPSEVTQNNARKMVDDNRLEWVLSLDCVGD